MMVANTIGSISKENLLLLAEARASFSTFLKMHFLSLPDLAFVQSITSNDIRSALEQLVFDENVYPEIAQGAKLMNDFLMSNSDTDQKQLSEILGIDRTRLYRGISPTYGPPPPYEAVWSADAAKQNEFLQEIASLYRLDGLMQAPDLHERVDYIGIELAYVEHLAREEAEALEASKTQLATLLLEREKAFLEQHLVNWIPKFVEQALQQARTDFYRGHLLMLRGFVLEQVEILSTISSAQIE